jgi:isopentenyl phosphate kinase
MLKFLKLGGSLITDKTTPFTPRLQVLDDLANQIQAAFSEDKNLQLLLGHGSGSFGHQAASRFGTRTGVSGQEGWQGFVEVWFQASALNRLVIYALRKAGLPAVTLAPFSMVSAHDGQVKAWNLNVVEAALANGLLPVLHGDVVFDEVRGGTILSTEDLFAYMAPILHPKRILLAGLERGVWEDFPARTHLIEEMDQQSIFQHTLVLGGSLSTDVTGGMQAKVTGMLALMEKVPGMDVVIFSGENPLNIRSALRGENPGTRLHC